MNTNILRVIINNNYYICSILKHGNYERDYDWFINCYYNDITFYLLSIRYDQTQKKIILVKNN